MVGSEEQVDSRYAGYESRQQLETEHYGKSVDITRDKVLQTFRHHTLIPYANTSHHMSFVMHFHQPILYKYNL